MPEDVASMFGRRARREAARDGKAELLRWIASQEVPLSSPGRKRGRFARYRHLLDTAGLIGLGFGAKVTAGRATGEFAIRAYVRRKMPLDRLSATQQVPPELAGVPTDVIQVGRPRFRVGSAFPGAAIRHQSGEQGSIGAFVRRDGSDRLHILSACHVLAPHGIAQPGDAIIRDADGINPAGRIATLTDFEVFSDTTGNRFDAAIAILDDGVETSLRIPNVGPPVLPAMHPVLFQSVRKQGASTLHTFGVVMDTNVDVPIGLGDEFFFTDIISVDGTRPHFSQGGDSGALVLDAISSRPVGLITGGGRDATFVSPIVRILDRFQANLAT